MSAPEEKYMSIEQVADLLGVTYRLIYRLVRSGELPAARIGKLYRIMQSDLNAYIERSKALGTVSDAEAAVCAACGRTYQSDLSMKGECEDCGRPICFDCWDRGNVRRCREHRVKS
jgi:excisionase family DNA binding protein